MFLEYGVNAHGELISVDQVPRGQVALICPYCGRPLRARKGAIKAPHFAHDGETCGAVERHTEVIALPAYDRFHFNLSTREYALYQDAAEHILNKSVTALTRQQFKGLESAGLVEANDQATNRYEEWELTPLGKVPLGELPLMSFNEVQEPLILEKHDKLQRAAYNALGSVDFETAVTDLRLYRAQMRRILSCTLYFLRIETPSIPKLYKIGVTTRSVDERISEITADLRAALGEVQVQALDTWLHRGNAEPYFKHRYRRHQYLIGNLTEYFVFDDFLPVLQDLRRMKPKALSDLETSILEGRDSELECRIPPEENRLSFDEWQLLRRLSDMPDETLTYAQGEMAWAIRRRQGDTLIEGQKAGQSGWKHVITSRGIAYLNYFDTFYRTHYASELQARP